MTVRAAQKEDALSIARINVDSWKASVHGHIPAELLQGLDQSIAERARHWAAVAEDLRSCVLLIEETDGHVVGFIHALPSRDPFSSEETAEITTLFVDPTQWDRGIGRDLLEAALRSLRLLGFSDVTLWVLDFNERAQRFYRAAGFEPDGSTKQSAFEGILLNEIRFHKAL